MMKNKSANIKKYNKIFWILFATPFLLLFIIFLLAANGALGYMPKIEDLENPKINLATEIISEDGEVLGTIYYTNQNRTRVSYERLPQHLIDALIATEDVRFYRHSGIDFRGLARAVIKTGILGNESSGGGSTITQQFAKLLFHKPAITKIERLKQKIKEWIIATKLERAYTKEEIITMYFNQYQLIYEAVGIHSGSQIFFNKLPDSLKIEEAAVLVGMAKNPSYYNPVKRPELIQGRRNTVLNQMAKYGYITEKECDSLKNIPMKIDFQRISYNVGTATYFREYIKQTLSADEPIRKNYTSYIRFQEDSSRWADDPLFGWCNKKRKPDNSPYNIYTDGLRIYTTINSRMQQFAEEAVKVHMGGELQPDFFKEKKGRRRAPFSKDLTKREIDQIIRHAIRYSDRGIKLYNAGISMDSIYKVFKTPVEMTVFSWEGEKDTVMTPLDSILYYKHFLHCGFISLDPHNGHVKAYVGGINYKHFKYDHVTQGKRQAGSTFKPFLYILAMQEGYSPCYEVRVQPITFRDNDTTWTPRSTTRKEDLGTLKTLKWGLALSDNYVSAFLVDRFKPQPIADIAYKMGIQSHIDPVPSMIYGTSDMSVEEMIGAYTPFVNHGIHTKPLYVTRIEDKYGNVLDTFQEEKKEAVSAKTSFLMLSLLRNVVDFTGGTASRLRWKYQFKGEIAGKTGTTNNNSDGWFIGMTPNLISGIWVGAEDRSVHFDYTSQGGGHNMALPIWAEYMKRVYADSTELGYLQSDIFEKPDGFNMNLDCKKRQDRFYYNEPFETDYSTGLRP